MTMQIAIITFLISFASITGWLLWREPVQIAQSDALSPSNKPSPSQSATEPAINHPHQEPAEQNTIIAISEAERDIKNKLLVVIPLVEFHETPFEEAINFLRLQIQEQTPDTSTGNIHFRLSNINHRHGDSLALENPDHTHAGQRVTLKAENISIAKVLNQICAQTNLHWTITDHGVLIQPR